MLAYCIFTAETRSTPRFLLLFRYFCREHHLIVFNYIWFRLDGELLFVNCAHPCAPPFGRYACVLLQATVNSGRKVTKRTPPRPVCPSGPRGIRLCLRAVLTRRPGSTGLNQASCLPSIFFLGPTKAECLGKLHGENAPPVKLAEDSFTDRVD